MSDALDGLFPNDPVQRRIQLLRYRLDLAQQLRQLAQPLRQLLSLLALSNALVHVQFFVLCVPRTLQLSVYFCGAPQSAGLGFAVAHTRIFCGL